jgi:hypothetical protein
VDIRAFNLKLKALIIEKIGHENFMNKPILAELHKTPENKVEIDGYYFLIY